MKKIATYSQHFFTALQSVSTKEKAHASRRYFPRGINCIGANAADIKTIITKFHEENTELNSSEVLNITEYQLKYAQYNEEVLIAFGLINKFVKKNYDDSLLLRFEYWLEHYANNWSLVDDLCIKTIYQFLLARPHLISQTQHWAHSQVPWCRRASNVVWVKFINRKMGKSFYKLDKALIFKNCDLLIKDKDEFVQKSIGWLLKVAAAEHETDVINYLHINYNNMPRSTIRYALEKVDASQRKILLNKLK